MLKKGCSVCLSLCQAFSARTFVRKANSVWQNKSERKEHLQRVGYLHETEQVSKRNSCFLKAAQTRVYVRGVVGTTFWKSDSFIQEDRQAGRPATQVIISQ